MKKKHGCWIDKKVICILIFLCLAINPLIGSVKTKMTVMTYNIRHAFGINETLDLDEVFKVISGENPDILILNEIDQGNSRSGKVFQAEYLAEKLGMEYVFGHTEERDDYGNAILSKYSIVESEVFDLPQPKWMKAVIRGCIRISVEINGNIIDIYGTHLGLGGFQEIQKELGYIYEKYKERKNPSIIAGDLNIEYLDLKSSIKGFFDDFRSANHYLGIDLHTFPSNFPGAQIDYILLSKGIEPVKVYTVDSFASDHLPIVCEIEVDNE